MALEECLITAIAKPAMIEVLHHEPKFSELFVAYLLTTNSRVEEDLIDQLFNSSESVSHAFSSCWRILARKVLPRPLIQPLVKKLWLK
jgi:hypothetical protein